MWIFSAIIPVHVSLTHFKTTSKYQVFRLYNYFHLHFYYNYALCSTHTLFTTTNYQYMYNVHYTCTLYMSIPSSYNRSKNLVSRFSLRIVSVYGYTVSPFFLLRKNTFELFGFVRAHQQNAIFVHIFDKFWILKASISTIGNRDAWKKKKKHFFLLTLVSSDNDNNATETWIAEK